MPTQWLARLGIMPGRGKLLAILLIICEIILILVLSVGKPKTLEVDGDSHGKLLSLEPQQLLYWNLTKIQKRGEGGGYPVFLKYY